MKFMVTFLLCALLSALPQETYSANDTLGRHISPTGDTLLLHHPCEVVRNPQETVYTSDSLILVRSQTKQDRATPSYLWLAVSAVFLLACCGLLYKRRRYLRRLSDLKQAQSSLTASLQSEKELARQEQQRLSNAAIANSPACREARRLLEKHKGTLHTDELLTPALWEQLQNDIDLYCNGFTRRLHEEHPKLKEQDIRFCCLVKAGFKYADMACLLGRTPNMMYKRRDAILARLSREVPGNDFEAFIRLY